MASVVTSDTMESSIVRAVQQEADNLREKAINNAVEAFEAELRQSVLRSAVSITNFYEVHRSGPNLTLTIRYKEHP